MADCVIGEGACVSYAILDSDVKVGNGCTVGKSREEAKGIAVVGTGISIPDGSTVEDGAMIYDSSDLVKEA